MAAVLEIQLLGTFRLVYGETPITSVESPRLQALLAYLLLNRDAPQARQHIAFLLFPDSSEAQARANLRNLIHHLRKALPDADSLLIADAQTLQWNAAARFTLDVAAFEKAAAQANSVAALREAVQLYRGELLAGCYDDWILVVREHLRQTYAETLERLILLLENQGNYREAISYAERLLRQDPLREDTYRHLMRLYALSGDTAGARRVYQTCVTVLARELDAEPGAETRAEFERITKQAARAESKPPPGTPRLKDAADFQVRIAPNNLPVQLTSFIGREQQIADLKHLLALQGATPARRRLLTLTGAGGSGKTRLAIHVAQDLLPSFQDGVWFVDLAPLSDPVLIPEAVASALKVQEQPGRPLLETVLGYLQGKELLLVLDNCEQFVSACAEIVLTLLQKCPRVQIIATSREHLNLAGETVWLVPTLSLPELEHENWMEGMRSEAVRLFVERGAAVLPTFTLTKQNASEVAQIVRQLDGIPLAIELAAARVKLLTPAQISARLDDALRLLTRGSHAAAPRQQTLRAAMDWSYALLAAQEQTLFSRLSVFVGGFTLVSAEQVCGDDQGQRTKGESESPFDSSAAKLREDKILDLLSDLVDKSLVVVAAWEEGNQVRYRLYEPIREYASEKLGQSGEASQVAERHLKYFIALAAQAEPHLYGAEQKGWLARLEREHDNIRAGLTWSTQTPGYSDLGLRLAGSLWHSWEVRGHLTEGRRWLEILLKNPGDLVQPRAHALSGLGTFLWLHGDFPQAAIYHEQALALYRSIDEAHGVAFALNNLGVQAGNAGEIDRAEVYLMECLTVARANDDTLMTAYALNNLGHVALARDDTAGASQLFRECLGLYQVVGAKFDSCQALDALARVAYLREDYDQAGALYKESMALAVELESKPFVAERLEGLAEVATAELRLTRAVRLCGAAEVLRKKIGATVSLVDQTEKERRLAGLREQLGKAEFKAAWDEGSKMTLEQAVEDALEQ